MSHGLPVGFLSLKEGYVTSSDELTPIFIYSESEDAYFDWSPKTCLAIQGEGFPRLLMRFEDDTGPNRFTPLLLQCATILKMTRSMQSDNGVEQTNIVMTAISVGWDESAYRYWVYLDEADTSSVRRLCLLFFLITSHALQGVLY